MSWDSAPPQPARVFGLDFSGAVQAGKKIWLAGGAIADGTLHVSSCRPAAELPGSGVARERCLQALRAFITQQGPSAFGCDFPFSLPEALLGCADWEAFARDFAPRYPDAATFRLDCVARGGGRELKRRCDVESRTPFCAYNLRLFRQTYTGIAALLAPLVRDGTARVLPMQPPALGVPWLLEVCPASSLKRHGLYLRGYKGRGAAPLAARTHILAKLETDPWFSLAEPLRALVLAEPEGDALDSVIAAYATAAVFREPERHTRAAGATYAREGYVYA